MKFTEKFTTEEILNKFEPGSIEHEIENAKLSISLDTYANGYALENLNDNLFQKLQELKNIVSTKR